jgi:hypothetical protein
MKQPVENANATPEEIEATLARAVPIVHDLPVITQEVAKLAYEGSIAKTHKRTECLG